MEETRAGASEASTRALKPTLGLVSATTLIVGSAIGSGIFLLPASVAGKAGAPGLTLIVWIVGGFLSIAGALTFAELGGLFPRAGGQFVFLREAYGDGAAFLFGWMMFFVAITGIIAAVATAFSIFVGAFFPLTTLEMRLVAIACIWFLTLVNWFGVRYGGVVQNVATFAKVAALVALVVLAFVVGRGTGAIVSPLLPAGPGPVLAAGFGLGLVAALFAFDGWSSVTFVASEIKNPQRTIPRAALLGVGIVTLVYVIANAAYLYVLPFPSLVGSQRAAFDVATALFGANGGVAISIAVIVSTFGTVNGYVLQGPRIYYAMAKDGLFYRGFGSVSKRNVPNFGLILQAEWASLLVLSGTYNTLVTYVVIGLWAFYALTGLALFQFRRKAADAPRPFRVPFYPILPALFVLAAVAIVANALINDPLDAGPGILLVLTGIPVYAALLWWRRRGTQASWPVERDPS
ncbi:MAG: APC family permease [Thermoplasmatota archaeon]